MNSKDKHPDLFTGFLLNFRKNVIRALIKTGDSINDMCENGRIEQDVFTCYLNNIIHPEQEDIQGLIDWLNERGYKWA
jgi:hypothetical protein